MAAPTRTNGRRRTRRDGSPSLEKRLQAYIGELERWAETCRTNAATVTSTDALATAARTLDLVVTDLGQVVAGTFEFATSRI